MFNSYVLSTDIIIFTFKFKTMSTLQQLKKTLSRPGGRGEILLIDKYCPKGEVFPFEAIDENPLGGPTNVTVEYALDKSLPYVHLTVKDERFEMWTAFGKNGFYLRAKLTAKSVKLLWAIYPGTGEYSNS